MTQYMPRWTYLLVALGIFAFQTLDAMDGKQARRTNSSTPLGKLFDHGCDAISWSITSMTLISFLKLGLSFNGILTMFATGCPFYASHIWEYYTDVFEYTVGVFDSTTGLLILIAFHLIAFAFGPEVYDWKFKDTFPSLPSYITREFVFGDIVIAFVVYIGVIFTFTIIYYLFKSVKDPKTKVVVALQLIQHFACYVILYLFNDKIPFIKENAGLVYMCYVFLFALISTKLIICQMAKMFYNIIHLEYFVFVIYFYYQYHYDGTEVTETRVKYSFYAVLLTLIQLYYRFIQGCIEQITKHLGIFCFKLGNRKVKSS